MKELSKTAKNEKDSKPLKVLRKDHFIQEECDLIYTIKTFLFLESFSLLPSISFDREEEFLIKEKNNKKKFFFYWTSFEQIKINI